MVHLCQLLAITQRERLVATSTELAAEHHRSHTECNVINSQHCIRKSLARWLQFRDSPLSPRHIATASSIRVHPARGLKLQVGRTPKASMEEGARKYFLFQLVNTGEFLHNLDQVIHRGLPLHSAAIINLKQEDRKYQKTQRY